MYSFLPATNLLINRPILITGAGQGIGRALAIGCALLGAQVIILEKTIHKPLQISKQITHHSATTSIIITFDLDLAIEDNYQTLYAKHSEQFLQLNGLINNASITPDLKPSTQLSIEVFNCIMQINVNASLALTKTLLLRVRSVVEAVQIGRHMQLLNWPRKDSYNVCPQSYKTHQCVLAVSILEQQGQRCMHMFLLMKRQLTTHYLSKYYPFIFICLGRIVKT